MKYIRTKKNNVVGCDDKDLVVCIIAFEPQKVADTIEELCDEFVEVYGDHKELVDLSRVVYYTKITLGEYYLNRIENRKALGSLIDDKDQDIKLYGAIWTDKGLIFVAKMNEKGELELL